MARRQHPASLPLAPKYGSPEAVVRLRPLMAGCGLWRRSVVGQFDPSARFRECQSACWAPAVDPPLPFDVLRSCPTSKPRLNALRVHEAAVRDLQDPAGKSRWKASSLRHSPRRAVSNPSRLAGKGAQALQRATVPRVWRTGRVKLPDAGAVAYGWRWPLPPKSPSHRRTAKRGLACGLVCLSRGPRHAAALLQPGPAGWHGMQAEIRWPSLLACAPPLALPSQD